MMMGLGFIEIIILLFFGLGGSVGVPLGMSPAPEDPLMAAFAPDDCLAYTTWSGSLAPPVDGNVAERWMAQPEIGDFWEQLQAAWFEYCLNGADDGSEAVIHSAAACTRHVLTHASAFYLIEANVGEPGPFEELTGGALFELGENPAELMEQINSILSFLLDSNEQQAETITIDGRTFQTLMVPNAVENRLTWGMVDDQHFAMVIGDGEMERLLARLKTPAPEWLTALRDRLPVDRVSSVSWINGEKAVGMITEMARLSGIDEQVEVFERLGLGQIRGVGVVTGLDEQGYLGRGHLQIEGNATGMFSLFSNDTLTTGTIGRIPNDRMYALGIAASPTRVFKLIQELMGMNDFARDEFEEALNSLNEMANLDLESDVIHHLDEHAFFYGSVNLANPSSGWVIGIGASEEMGLSDPFEKIVGLIRDNAGDAFELQTSDVDGNTFYTLDDKQGWTGMGGASWALADGELLFSMDKTTMRRHLRREPLANDALANDEWFVQLFTPPSTHAGGPVIVSSLDLPQVLRLAIPLASPFVDQMLPAGFDYSMDDLPSMDALTREMKPNLTAIYPTADGFESVQRQTFPGGSSLNLIPATSIAALPSIIEIARSAARTDSANRMRQMVLAMHNYHDAHKSLPARFNKNDAGEPMLSWRVQILPFIGYQELYERFHMDEPWDSDHNKALIDQMPEEFAHPKMKLDPGKTVYVAPQGTDSVMVDPKDSRTSPRGATLETIFDGTSRTAMILEVAQDNAVIWTQPSDYPWEDHVQPVSGLYEGWKDGFNIALCDGSVQFLSNDKVTQFFVALVQTNDGEAIDLWSDR